MKTVYLIGAGMGTRETLTLEALGAIEQCGLLLGAGRLLAAFSELSIPQKPLVMAEDILAEILQTPAQTIGVLLSGDPGFYSGARGLAQGLKDCRVITLPGSSSVNYFCARLGISWQDVALLSVHGRDCNVLGQVQTGEKCLFLTGGKQRAEDLCRLLTDYGYGELQVTVGESLSYPQERIIRGTARELAQESILNLSVLLVENPTPLPQVPRIPVLWDSAFQRGKVPMTKELVRLAVLAELSLSPQAIVWDVGAGTGSVSVACALAAPLGRVYAVEQAAPALELLQRNQQAFAVSNLSIIAGRAPEVLEALPAPEAVFIGGSTGEMAGIFRLALEKNPGVRLVLTAVSLESFMDGLACIRDFAMEQPSVRQLTATQSRELGSYHLMQGENPVWILSAKGKGATP